MNKFILSFTFLLAFPTILLSQSTGNFDTTVTFQGNQRTISYHVPNNYDSTKDYRLIIALHGLGDNSSNFRNTLTSNLHWHKHFQNTIIACPDGGSDRASDFYAPWSDRKIIQKSLEFSKGTYSIDTSRMILSGFSLGGARALKYGLNNHSKFKGLFLNTPAVQGMKNAMSDTAYTYSNASEIPVFFTIGRQDQTYVNINDTLYNKLASYNGIVKINRVQGLGHSIPEFHQIDSVLKFFNNPAEHSWDLSLIKTYVRKRTCDSIIHPHVAVQNRGAKTIQSFDITYQWGNNTKTFTWTGSLDSFEYVSINQHSLTSSAGKQNLSVEIGNINSSVKDTFSHNNQLSDTFEVNQESTSLPVKESFETNIFPPENWHHNTTGKLITYTLDATAGTDGKKSLFAANSPFIFNNMGLEEDLVSPVLDLSGIKHPKITFDVAFNYPRFIVNNDTAVLTDTLKVAISTDCGKNYETVYRKWGKELSTFDNPIENPGGTNQMLFTPSSDNWRTEYIDLTNYSGKEKVTIKISYSSGLGGVIYLDNIKIQNNQAYSRNLGHKDEDFRVFPNPADDQVFIEWQDLNVEKISVYGSSGKRIMNNTFDKKSPAQFRMNTSHLKNGIYLIRVNTDEGPRYRKLLIR